MSEETNFHTEDEKNADIEPEAVVSESELTPDNDVLALTSRLEQLERDVESAKAEAENATKDKLYAYAELQNYRRRKSERGNLRPSRF